MYQNVVWCCPVSSSARELIIRSLPFLRQEKRESHFSVSWWFSFSKASNHRISYHQWCSWHPFFCISVVIGIVGFIWYIWFCGGKYWCYLWMFRWDVGNISFVFISYLWKHIINANGSRNASLFIRTGVVVRDINTNHEVY